MSTVPDATHVAEESAAGTQPRQQRSRETRRSLLDAALAVLTRDVLIEATVTQFYADLTQQLRTAAAALPTDPGGAAVSEVLTLVVESFSSDFFKAALHVWSAAAGPESDLRDLIVAADSRFAREVYQLMAMTLDADLSDQHTRRLLRTTIDLARGLGLGAVLVDNAEHRTTTTMTWTEILESGVVRNS